MEQRFYPGLDCSDFGRGSYPGKHCHIAPGLSDDYGGVRPGDLD